MATQLGVPEDTTTIRHALVDLPPHWRLLEVLGPDVRGVRATVLVGPPGVFVLRPAKAPRGRALDRLLGVLVDVTDALALAAGVRREEVHAVVCVTDEQHVDTWRHGVAICTPGGLLDTVTHRRVLLGPDEVDDVARALVRALNKVGRHRRVARG